MNKKRKKYTGKPYYLSASIICSDMLELKKDLSLLEKGDIDFVHFDVMDGIFVPRYGVYPEILESVKKVTKKPMDVHMMVQDPELYIPTFIKAGADIIAVPAETCPHLHRTIQLIKKNGAKAGVALNPATPLNVLDYIIDDIDMVVLMAINPGIVGHKIISNIYEKISKMRDLVSNRSDFLIQIDGGVNFKSGPKMIMSGANVLVCGASTIFQQGKPIDKKIKDFRKVLNTAL